MPFLEGFPPKEELPSTTWARKLSQSFVFILLGYIRYSSSSTSDSVDLFYVHEDYDTARTDRFQYQSHLYMSFCIFVILVYIE